MSLNRTAKGIVLVPSLLLGGAFLAAAAWLDGPAAANRGLAIGLGLVLMGAGLLAQLLPESEPENAED
ncbi:GIVxVP protein [Synechococcus sp. CBW1004]|jgi:hypothetical protein|uniref:GIVxVP protein n=1 Tax=Synechococcus sp. CBW1004 TaxID=1353136 RepID=UPI0018CF01A4|nr:GIVxVP protein [Synechococcus sp. CBW1004]QPN64232.1 hypothetical protein H8F25_05470 [Synechococcus sp. CBW1004]